MKQDATNSSWLEQRLLSRMLEKPDFGVLVTNIPSTGVKQALGR